jgi:hypothetical protein
MYLWLSRREQALSDKSVGWASLCPRSMAASSAMLVVCVGGVEVTKIFREVCEIGWVTAAPREAEPPLSEPSV